MSEKDGYHCRIWGKWILIWKLTMMGTLFKVLKMKTRSKDPLSIKAEQLMYFPRTLEENWLDKIFNEFGWNLSS